MAKTVSGTVIENVAIVDDDAASRKSYELPLEDLSLSPDPVQGPLPNLQRFVAEIAARSDAALCDHHLRKANYADFNGAEVVASWYAVKFPAVLCTKWEKAEIDQIRRHRSRIPVLIQPEELAKDPETFIRGLEEVLFEMNGDFRPSRRPWRTQVSFPEVDDNGLIVYAEVPAWPGGQVIRLQKTDLPETLLLQLKPDYRCHAKVNIGAERQEDLYFLDWET